VNDIPIIIQDRNLISADLLVDKNVAGLSNPVVISGADFLPTVWGA
jgi:hypothetical protein